VVPLAFRIPTTTAGAIRRLARDADLNANVPITLRLIALHAFLHRLQRATAGVPLYQVRGGKRRQWVDTYRHDSGGSWVGVEERVRGYQRKGYGHIRVHIGVPGQATYGSSGGRGNPEGQRDNNRVETWDPKPYCRVVPKLFEHLRKKLGDEVELLHDMHER